MNHSLFQLSDFELILKKLYLNGNKQLFKSPMSYEEFKELSASQTDLLECSNFFAGQTRGHLGITIVEVEKISKGDEILIFVNERYTYPILHNHSYIEMFYVFEGSCTHFVEGQTFTMNSGDFCILAPNAMHALATESDDAIIINLLVSRTVFNNSFLKLLRGGSLLIEFFENILFHKRVSPYVVFPTNEDPWLHQVMLNMLMEYRKKSYAYKESLELYTRQLFIHIIRNYEMFARVSDTIDNSQDNNIVAILGYISVNYTHITLKELAIFFNYNEAYISRLLKRYTGKTFGLLITELQMKYAKELIEEGCFNMAEISQKVGCFDASHLNRKFKKIYGIPPIAFKKNSKTPE